MIKRFFESWTFPGITLAALLVAGTLFQHASQVVAADDIPASVVEELKPQPDHGARLLSDISEEAQKVWRKHLTETSHRVMQSLSREHKQQIYNTMVSASGMSMRDMFNFMAAKKKVAEGVTFDEVIEAMDLKANEVNFKKVGHNKLWQDISAISGLPALRLEILHYCDAVVGSQMVAYAPEFSIFIPCRISVLEDATGEIWIMTLDWDVTWLSMAWHPDSKLPADLIEHAIRIRDGMEQIMVAGATGEW